MIARKADPNMFRLVKMLLFLLLVIPASGIVWRADIKSAEAKQRDEMKQVGKVYYSPLKVFGGSCYSLGGKWVLTSRHGTEKWNAKMLAVDFPELGKSRYSVKRVVFPEKGDFALLELDKKVRAAKAVTLFKAKATKGQRAWIGGFGRSGPAGKVEAGGTFYAGHNRVDGIRNDRISISLSKPEDETAEKDEATLALFDSGSPIFLEVNGKWQLSGIASTATNGNNPGYGDRGNYARISTIAEWIEKTMR